MYNLTAPLILASASPRRRELLQDCGIKFEIQAANINEQVQLQESPKDLVMRLASEKVSALKDKFPKSYILGADTDVALGNKIFGKPQSKIDCIAMLAELSGSTHQVFGGVAVYDPFDTKIHTVLSRTDVTFRKLSREEIEAYSETKEPYDKAGAYAAQGLGASFVEKIEGSYTNVVGLDLSLVLELFRKLKILVCK